MIAPNAASIESPRLPLKVVLVAMYYDYGKKERGPGYEYNNLFLTCREIFAQADFFDFGLPLQERGQKAMNDELVAFVRERKPDLTIFCLYQDEFLPEVIDALGKEMTTLGYFFDDTWRQSYVRLWAPRFDFFTTSSLSALRTYRDLGLTHALYSPLGYNHFMYQKKDLPVIYDVSFVGSIHGHRQWIVNQLKKAGIAVSVWGAGWETGRLTQEQMIDVFNQSKLVLTLSNSLNYDARYFLQSPRWALRDLRYCKKHRDQIKARHFEVSGCGSCQISYYVEDLEHCYEIGKEILIFMDVDDLIEKIRYYLRHDDERSAIAEAGYRRATRDHTLERRFRDIATAIQATRH